MREREAVLLDSAAAAMAKDKGVDVELMDRLLGRKRDATKAVIELKDQLNDLNHAIRVLKAGYVGKCETTVVATVIARREGKFTFQLTYRKHAIHDHFDVHRSLLVGFTVGGGVSWRLSYDLHGRDDGGRPHLSRVLPGLLRKHHANYGRRLEQCVPYTEQCELTDTQEPLRPDPVAARARST